MRPSHSLLVPESPAPCFPEEVSLVPHFQEEEIPTRFQFVVLVSVLEHKCSVDGLAQSYNTNLSIGRSVPVSFYHTCCFRKFEG